jgi:hypothetical protein
VKPAAIRRAAAWLAALLVTAAAANALWAASRATTTLRITGTGQAPAIEISASPAVGAFLLFMVAFAVGPGIFHLLQYFTEDPEDTPNGRRTYAALLTMDAAVLGLSLGFGTGLRATQIRMDTAGVSIRSGSSTETALWREIETMSVSSGSFGTVFEIGTTKGSLFVDMAALTPDDRNYLVRKAPALARLGPPRQTEGGVVWKRLPPRRQEP